MQPIKHSSSSLRLDDCEPAPGTGPAAKVSSSQAGSSASIRRPQSPPVEPRTSGNLDPTGPLAGLQIRKQNLPDLNRDIHLTIADHLPMSDVASLAIASKKIRESFKELLASRKQSYESLRGQISSASSVEDLFKLIGIGTPEPGKTAVLGWDENIQKKLFQNLASKMSNALESLKVEPEKFAEDFDRCIVGFGQMKPEELSAAGVFHTATFINTRLLPEKQQGAFDQVLDTIKNYAPENRALPLLPLTQLVFQQPDAFSGNAIERSRTNVARIADASLGIAPKQLRPIAERLVTFPALVLFAFGQGDWQSPLNNIIELASRLPASECQTIHEHLSDSLEIIEQNFGPAGIEMARRQVNNLLASGAL